MPFLHLIRCSWRSITSCLSLPLFFSRLQDFATFPGKNAAQQLIIVSKKPGIRQQQSSGTEGSTITIKQKSRR
jgi:hypothetical protein